MYQRELKQSGKQVYDAFVNEKDGKAYLRIYCGLGLPYGDKPGFLVVLGEDFEQDFSLAHSPRHFRVLAEYESVHLEALYRNCLKFITVFQLGHILANSGNPVFDIWKKFDETPDSKVTVRIPHDFSNINMNLVAQLIKKNIGTQKTLHFGKDSSLPAHVAALNSDSIETPDIESYPAIAALGIALAELERTSPRPHVRLSTPVGPLSPYAL